MIELCMIGTEGSRVSSTRRIWRRYAKRVRFVTLLSRAAHPFALVELFEVI
jgi:hypothetical protein